MSLILMGSRSAIALARFLEITVFLVSERDAAEAARCANTLRDKIHIEIRIFQPIKEAVTDY